MSDIIKVNHLKKYFHETKAVDDISFSVKRGEMFGFLGVNGAGKSTTISMLCTLLKPTDGKVEIAGFALGKEDEEIKRKIGVVYQWNVLDDLLTVKENLICRGSLYEKDGAKLKRQMEYVCEILALSDVLKRPYGKLSGGQKRRCEIGAALLHTPEILFLDEPTTGLDPATRKSVWQTVGRLQKELKMTVSLTTHYMEEAAKADHIGIIEKGKMVQQGTPFSLKEQFAKDRMIIRFQDGKKGQIEEILKDMGCSYKMKKEKIIAYIPETLDAIPLIGQMEYYMKGFEVIQGTMDDVFLNVTGMEQEKQGVYGEGEKA